MVTQVPGRAVLPGREISYWEYPGSGTPLLMVHGMGSSAATWGSIPEKLSSAGIPVLVVDLPGHGASSKEPGDYSLGSLASSLRDLLDERGIAKVHLLGHSLGGGISLQFTYQFPERVDRLVLVASGGLGEETFGGLRAAALPGADLFLKITVNERTLGATAWVREKLALARIRPGALAPESLSSVSGLADEGNRRAFLSTLRSVIGLKGQRVSALDKLHLIRGERVLLIWGDRDVIIPVAHGENAHGLLPGSRFVVFPGAGHEPYSHDPDRFIQLVADHLT